MRPVPESPRKPSRPTGTVCAGRCWQNTWAARAVLDLSTMPKHPSLQWVPDWLWAQQLKSLEPFVVWLTVGLYDEPVRELMDYSWSGHDARLHWLFGRAVNLALQVRAPAREDASARTWRLGSRRGPQPCRRAAGAHAGTQPASPQTERRRSQRFTRSPAVTELSRSFTGVLSRTCASRPGSPRACSSAAFCRASNCWAAVRPSGVSSAKFGCAQSGSEPGLDLLPHAFERRHTRRRVAGVRYRDGNGGSAEAAVDAAGASVAARFCAPQALLACAGVATGSPPRPAAVAVGSSAHEAHRTRAGL